MIILTILNLIVPLINEIIIIMIESVVNSLFIRLFIASL